VLTSSDLDRLIADTEGEMERVIEAAQDERTTELYRWIRFHLGLDRGRTAGQAPPTAAGAARLPVDRR